MIRSYAMTMRATGLVPAIIGPVQVATPTADTVTARATHECQALWDTGASASVITEAVAAALGIAPTGRVKVQTANDERDSNVYLVDILLKNGVAFPNVTVTEGTIRGYDVLIGMDIITQGDLAITNAGGKTVVSFRCPAYQEIDYLKEAPNGFLPGNREERRILDRTGRLNPASLGSSRPTGVRRK